MRNSKKKRMFSRRTIRGRKGAQGVAKIGWQSNGRKKTSISMNVQNGELDGTRAQKKWDEKDFSIT